MTRLTVYKPVRLILLALSLTACGGGGGSGSGGDLDTDEDLDTGEEPVLSCPGVSGSSVNKLQNVEEDGATLNKKVSATRVISSSAQDPVPVDLWQPDREELPEQLNLAYLEYSPLGSGEPSDAQTQLFTSADSYISVDSFERSANVYAANEISFFISFLFSESMESIEEGYYPITENKENIRGLQFDWYGQDCDLNDGWIVVDKVTNAGDQVSAIELRFELSCIGTLNGFIRWRSDDSTLQPGPQDPIPEFLWQPDEDLEELDKNYVYLEAKPGDFFGEGYTHLYTQENSLLELSGFEDVPFNAERLELTVSAEKDWRANFMTMFGHSRFEVGYYQTTGNWGDDPTMGSFSVTCNSVIGWYTVDHVVYNEEGELAEIDMRFEQYCGNGDEPLHGKIRWRHDDPTLPPGPQYPPPDGLWEADSNVNLPSGNYVYIEGDEGDFLTNGHSHLFTDLNSLILREESEWGYVAYISAHGDYSTGGYLHGSSFLPRLQLGYYGPFIYDSVEHHNPAKGHLYWDFDHRACGTGLGWFVIDDIGYGDDGQLSRLKARLEYQCQFDAAARVQVQWSSNEKTLPPGPINPVPQDVWQPDNSVPTCSENYIYIESDFNEYVGGGERMMTGNVSASSMEYESADSWQVTMSSASEKSVTIHIDGIYFQDKLEPGYYEFFQGNPAKGMISISVDHRSCHGGFGWFAIDEVGYDSEGDLTNLSIRFEQHCALQPEKSLKGKAVWRNR